MLNKIKQLVIDFLVFTRFINGDGNLSITNIAVIIVLYKLATTPSTNITDCGALFLSLTHYGFKKYLNKNVVTQAATIANEVIDKTNVIITKSEETSS